MENKSVKGIIDSWLNPKLGFVKKFPGGTIDIALSTQDEFLNGLFLDLKKNEFTREEVLPYARSIANAMAPNSFKAYLALNGRSKMPREEAMKKFEGWVWSAAKKFSEYFNEYYGDQSEGLDPDWVYRFMCGKRGIRPQNRNKSEPTEEEILGLVEVEGNSSDIKQAVKKTGIGLFEFEKLPKRFEKIKFKDTQDTQPEEFSSVDQEALKFFGLDGIPKERL